jgi:hypothetical protein
LARKQSQRGRGKISNPTKGKGPMTKSISLRMRVRNHIVTWKEAEFTEEDRVVQQVLLEEEGEAEEEK